MSSVIVAEEESKLVFNVPNKTVRAGLCLRDGFYNIQNNETVNGYGYDYIQQLKRYTSWNYEYVDPKFNQSEQLSLLEDGKLDLFAPIEKTPEQEAKFAFSQYPIGHKTIILTTKKDDRRFRSGDYKNWNGIRIGLLKNNDYEKLLTELAQKKGFSLKTVLYEHTDQMFRDLQNGTVVDAVLSDNMRRFHNEVILEQLKTEPLYIVVHKANTSLLAELNSAMNQLNSDVPTLRETLWNRYFLDTSGIVYTESERDFIDKARKSGHKFKAVLNPDRYPISYFSDGQNCGFMKDIADEITRQSELDIEFQPVSTPEEYQKACKNPEIDMIFDVKEDLREAEMNGLILSQPYISLSASMLCYREHGTKMKNIALVDKYRISEDIRSKFPADIVIRPCKSTQEAISLVLQGKCDATCLHTSTAESVIRDNPLVPLECNLIHSLHMELAVGIRNSRNPLLASILCKSVASIDEGFVVQARMNRSVTRESVFSFSQFTRQYPLIVYGIPCLVLLSLCLILWRLLLARKNSYRLGVVFSNLPFRYFIADSSGTVLQYNYGNESNMSGFNTLDDIKDNSARVPIKTLVSETLETGKTREQIYREEERIRLSMVSCLPRSMFGRPTVIGVSQDITELQNMRDEARRNEEYFRLTLRSISDGVMTTDQKGNIVLLNPVAERMFGVKTSEVVGLPHTNYFKLVGMEDDSFLDSPVLRTILTGHIIELAHPVDLLTEQGQEAKRYHIAVHSSPIHDEQANVIGAILVFRDMSMEYNRQREIQEEFTHWDAIATNMQIYRFRYKPTTREVTAASKGFSQIWPIKNGKAVPAEDWICPDDIEQWKRSYNDIIDGKKKGEFFEFRVCQEGKYRYFRGYFCRTEEPHGELTGFIQETTQNKEAIQKQNAIQNLWTACINAMPVTFFIKSANDDFRYVLCNQKFARLLGKEVEEVIGHTDAELFSHSNDAEHFRECDQKVMDGGKALRINETASYVEGEVHHFMTVKVPVTDIDGKPALLGMSLDETEDFNHRQLLNNVLEDWELASKVAKIASYRLNNKMEILSQTDRISDFWPIRDGKPQMPEEVLHPDDIVPYYEMYASVFEGRQEEASMLCHIPSPDGMRFIRLFIKRNANRPNEISGLVQNITEIVVEQKKREALLSMWKNVIDSMPVMFMIKNADDDFRYLQTNGNFSSLFGPRAQEIIGQKEKDFFSHSKDAEPIYADDLKVMTLGRRQDFIETIHDHEDVLRYFHAVKLPMINESGQRVLISMALDITDAQEASEVRGIISSAFETLFVSNDLAKDLKTVLKNICEFSGFDRAFICCVDEDTDSLRMFTTCVPEGEQPMFDPDTFRIDHLERLSHYVKSDGLIDSNVFHIDFTNKRYAEIIQRLIPSLMQKAEEFDIRGLHMNCVLINQKIWGVLGFMTRGRKVKSLSVNEKRLLNITAHIVELAITRKRTMMRLENALRDALAADKAKSFFLSCMSHEIRTPLNAVIGFTDLLKNSELDRDTQMDYLVAISNASQDLLTLLNDILDLSKLTSGTEKSQSVLTNVQDFASEMDTIFRPCAQEKNLIFEFWASEIPNLYIDQSRFRQILYNLIDNAIKFTTEGEIVVSLSFVETDSEFGELTLKVSDTGRGIDQEDQDKLFEPFTQLAKFRGTNASGTGTGLGLPIVKKIVEYEGGTLSLDSEVGRGSTFTIVWPKVQYQAAQIQQETPRNCAESSTEEKTSDAEVFVPRVLVVDDSETNLKSIGRILQSLDIPYAVTFSGKDALERLKNRSFDIVVTEIIMPEMKGDELALVIRSRPQYARIRIVAMSTEKEAAMYDKSLFDHVMFKPIVHKALYDSIFGNADVSLKGIISGDHCHE